MRNTKLSAIFLSILAFFFSSCERQEGEGGRSAIEGQVYLINDAGTVAQDASGEYYFQRDTIPAVEEDVYIIYGSNDEDFYGDKTKTDRYGRYRFDYLVSGTYSVYAYTAYPNGGKEAVVRKDFVGDSKTKTMEDIYVMDGKNVGQSAIVGNIRATGNYIGPAVDTRVYLSELGVVGPATDEKTNHAGQYVFARLAPGKTYQVWAISTSRKNGVETAVLDTIFVESPSSIYKADTLTVGIY